MTVDAFYPLEGATPIVPDETVDDGSPRQIEQETAHTAVGQDQFIEQYKERPRLYAWLASYLDEVQAVENALWAVRLQRMIENATDAQLDALGRLVGQQRNGLSDDDYRIWIRARIAVNNSDGLGDDVIRVLQIILNDPNALIGYEDKPPASLLIRLLQDIGAVDPYQVQALLQEATGAGIRLQFAYMYDDPSTVFTLGNSSAYESDVDTGLGNTEDSGTGGVLAGVIG